MSVKVLVNSIGQQIIADTKQVENKDTNEIVGYWVTQPRIVNYNRNEEGDLGVNFVPYCLVSDEAEFSIRANDIVAILEPRDDVTEGYKRIVYGDAPAEEATEETTDEVSDVATTDATGTDSVEGSDADDSVDGAA